MNFTKVTLLAILFCIGCSAFVIQPYTSWTSLADNQAITHDALIEGKNSYGVSMVPPYQTIPTGSKCVTKAEAVSYNVGHFYGLESRADNELITKLDFQVFKLDLSPDNCYASDLTQTVHGNFIFAAIDVGKYLYTDRQHTSPFVGDNSTLYGIQYSSSPYLNPSQYYIKVNLSGMITHFESCTLPTKP